MREGTFFYKYLWSDDKDSPQRLFKVKTLLKCSSLEPKGQCALDLVCSISDVGLPRCKQIMTLG